MSGRFPGAADVEDFWANLCAGRDSIRLFTDAELDPSLAAELLADPDYVKARGVLQGVDQFDAEFFGISQREAELTDPQQRLLLELAWECLERAGYGADEGRASVGVFAGMYNASYYQNHLLPNAALLDAFGAFNVTLLNEKDFVATRIAHRLNLTGPAVSLHTACSTSLVAIAQAVTALRSVQCDLALAGGASISCPNNSGYLAQDGGMLSKDGQTRPFDANAHGTVFSDGAGLILLKRLDAALADGDHIHAIIRGAAINNDGRDKASFTAPSVSGQRAVIRAALADAQVSARSVSYVEAHGTATPIGDPIEIEALSQAFAADSTETGFCTVGSLKANVGHLVIAAGVASVIKTAFALEHEDLPASIHFRHANPLIPFARSAFRVQSERTRWPRGAQARRAGVSGFGVGGTNAHVVLEEAPLRPPSSPADGAQLLLLSARSQGALDRTAARLAEFLEQNPGTNLADVAFTLQCGREQFSYRMSVAASETGDAQRQLRAGSGGNRMPGALGSGARALVWLFPGQGSQYAGMAAQLYQRDAAFRSALDAALACLPDNLPTDLRARLFAADAGALSATRFTQPALFCVSYALAQAWRARGVTPAAMIGHSVGEFTAAVVAGVMTLDDAARLVSMRARRMQAQPEGGMLAVQCARETILALLPDTLSLAAENAPRACVIAGPRAALAAFEKTLAAAAIGCRALMTSHAFHSPLMDGAVAGFRSDIATVRLDAPRLPIVSTLTGHWLKDEEATSPEYWVRHMREPVLFSPALRTVQARHRAVFLELGPRGTLCALVRQHATSDQQIPLAIASLGDRADDEAAQFLRAQGALWSHGQELTVAAASPPEARRRIVLPTYPFERKACWVAAPVARLRAAPDADSHTTPHLLEPTAHTMPTPAIPAPQAARKASISTQVCEIFAELLGTDLAQTDPAASFLELGLDSLTLTQAAIQLKRHFKVVLSFRQLMEQYRSLDALVGFLDAQLPPDASPAAIAATHTGAGLSEPGGTVQTAPGSTVHTAQGSAMQTAPGSALQHVIQQQLEVMSLQLQLMQQGRLAEGERLDPPAPMAAQAPQNTQRGTVPLTPAGPTASATLLRKPEASTSINYDVSKAFGAIARIHTRPLAITERQQARLDAFMRRYIERTQKSRAYTERYRTALADPRVVNGFRPATKEIVYQIVIDRSQGAHVWDLDGNRYVDALNGFGMNLFGWQADFIQHAVRTQLEAGYEIGPQHPLAGEVAELVCELTGFDRAGLCNTGSEAVMAALRIARTVTGRNTVVLFSGSYHGTFDEVVVRPGRAGKGLPGAPGLMSGVYGDVRVLDYGTADTLSFLRQHAGDLAAVLVEPVQSRRPDFQPREFLQECRVITEQGGACLIFDEVITGFRAHLGGTQALFGIKADLACYGKVMGGGMPIGVVAGRRAYMDALDGGHWDYGDGSIPGVGVTYFAGTFVRHPLALAAAKAALLHLKQAGPALQNTLNQSVTELAEDLNAFCLGVGAPLEIRYFSSLWRISWLADHPLQDLLFAMMRSRGIHILDNFPCFITTAHTAADLDVIKAAFKASVTELQDAEFLPRAACPAPSLDASKPPVSGARLGRSPAGKPAWFVPDPNHPDQYVMLA